MFNLNKLVAGTSVALAAMTAATAFGATDAQELADAISWGYDNELTSYNSVDAFMPYNTLTREQGAKFFSAFATLNLCKEPDETASCDFSDLDQADASLSEYAVLACQLGLFKGSNGKFMPKAPFMKNEVLTVLMRAIDGSQDENVSPWWKNYFMAAKEAGITTEANAEGLARPVTRGEAIRLMYRAKSDEACNASGDGLGDLLGDLFGNGTGTTSTGTTATTGTTTTPVVTPTSNGGLKCMLASDTPAGATVPAGVSVSIATYECEATKDAVTIDGINLARQGISDNNSIASVSVFANDELVSKNKSFNSDATANISLSPKVTVAAGAKVKLNVVAKLGAASNNQRVKVALTDFASNGTNDKSALPAVGNQFEIVNVTPASIEVKSVGGIANVRLGQKNVKVAKFEIKNSSADNVDVTVNQITMRDVKSNVDDNLANVVLKNRGNTIATIADPMSKSVTFKLATPVVVKKGQTETFDVYADAVDGAGEMIDLQINNEVYVLGSDSRYGYGVAVNTSSYTSQVFTITAGKITLTKLANPSRLTRADQDDVVLANVQITSNESKNLTLEDIKFVSNTGVSTNSYFENVELRVVNGGSYSTYTLENTNSTTYGDTDLSISLPASGSITLQLIADVKKPLPAGFTGVSFNYGLSASNLRIIENTDDNQVTDIVPSSVSFDTMRFVDASASVSTNNLSDVSVVKGASNVLAASFNLLTDEVSPVRFETIVMGGNSEFNSNRVSAVRLYKGVYPNGTLIKEDSQFAGNTITLDDVNIEVPAKSTQPMYVTIDTVSIAGTAISTYVTSITAKDAANNDSLTVSGLPADSTRAIVTTSAGTLTTSLITSSDSLVNKAKVVVGGATSPEVAAVELNLSNDSATLKNLRFVVSGTNFNGAVNNVKLMLASGTIIDGVAESVGANTFVFNNVDYVLPAGTTKLYVKVDTNQIGNNGAIESAAPFAIRLDGVDVEWTSDGGTVTYAGPANYSNIFSVRAVRISNVSVASAASSIAPNSVDKKLAGITFTADTSSNTTAGGFALKAKIETLKISFGGAIAPAVTAAKLKDNAGNTLATCTVASNVATCSAITNALIDQGGTNTFYVHVDTNNNGYTSNADTLTVSVNNLDTDVAVSSADSNGVTISGPNTGLYLTSSTGPSVTINE